MSKIMDLKVDDLDIDLLSMTVEKLNLYNAKIANIVAERDKYAGILARHLDRLAADKGIVSADYDLDLGIKSFVPKPATEVSTEVKV